MLFETVWNLCLHHHLLYARLFFYTIIQAHWHAICTKLNLYWTQNIPLPSTLKGEEKSGYIKWQFICNKKKKKYIYIYTHTQCVVYAELSADY